MSACKDHNLDEIMANQDIALDRTGSTRDAEQWKKPWRVENFIPPRGVQGLNTIAPNYL